MVLLFIFLFFNAFCKLLFLFLFFLFSRRDIDPQISDKGYGFLLRDLVGFSDGLRPDFSPFYPIAGPLYRDSHL